MRRTTAAQTEDHAPDPMGHTTTALSFALPVSLLLAAPLAAQDHGSITGTLDLEPARWTLSGADDLPESTWATTEDGIEFVLYGYPGPNPTTMQDAITLAFFADGTATEADVTDSAVELQKTVDGQVLRADAQNIDITVETLVRQGDRIVIAGSLVAVMTPGGAPGRALSPEDDVTFDGNFQATVDRSE